MVPGGVMPMLVGATQTIEIVFAGLNYNKNIKTEALARGWSGTTPIQVKVRNIGQLGSTATGTAALQTGTGWPAGSKITLENTGLIMGKGGAGGTGGIIDQSNNSYQGSPGSAGGDALRIDTDITIDNGSGSIWGGGGGGGGGGSIAGVLAFISGSGGGGGAGLDIGSGGSAGSWTRSGTVSGNSGASAPGTSQGGAGGGQVHVHERDAFDDEQGHHPAKDAYNGAGGTGGGPGASGSTGGTSFEQSDGVTQPAPTASGGIGGVAGHAIRVGSGAITWLAGSGSPNVKGTVGA